MSKDCFANAALHFVPNHHEFMVRLVSFLHEGGRLAVQMPNNIQELSHALMRMVAADGRWAKRLVPIAKTRPMIGAWRREGTRIEAQGGRRGDPAGRHGPRMALREHGLAGDRRLSPLRHV